MNEAADNYHTVFLMMCQYSISWKGRGGCCLFPFLLLFDWIMKRVSDGAKIGIRWIARYLLPDLHFVAVIGLLCANAG